MPDAHLPPLLVLRCVPGLGSAGWQRMVREGGTAEAAVASLPRATQEAARSRAREVLRRSDDARLTVLGVGLSEYPEHLLSLEDPPPVLFVRGRIPLLRAPSVALVGTRAPSPYGVRTVRRLSRALADEGVTVVSGLARGVDALAHEAAVAGSSSTVAVLGTGADLCYPRQNVSLYDAVVRQGTIVSEMLPGAPPHPGSFPRRNRLIAALADLTVVVEAGVRSGALITARHATALGRPVAAVPGPVDVATSEGANALLRDGAHVVTGPADLLSLLDLTPRGRTRVRSARPPVVDEALTTEERGVMQVLALGPRLPDELIAATGLAATRLVVAVASLELRGVIGVDGVGLVHGLAPEALGAGPHE